MVCRLLPRSPVAFGVGRTQAGRRNDPQVLGAHS